LCRQSARPAPLGSDGARPLVIEDARHFTRASGPARLRSHVRTSSSRTPYSPPPRPTSGPASISPGSPRAAGRWSRSNGLRLPDPANSIMNRHVFGCMVDDVVCRGAWTRHIIADATPLVHVGAGETRRRTATAWMELSQGAAVDFIGFGRCGGCRAALAPSSRTQWVFFSHLSGR
jgi:hypothetical protein